MAFVDPALPLQKAVVALLKADAGVAALVAGRVYDAVPTAATKPYIALGPFQMVPEHGDCLDGGECFLQVDGYAPGPDTVASKRLGAAIAAALDEAEFMLDGQRLVGLSVEQIQYLREPDGITTHAAVALRALTDPL